MYLKPRPNCRVCQVVPKNNVMGQTLLKRIANSGAYIPGGESLLNIMRDYPGKFIYPTLLNHCKKHQGMSELAVVKARTKIIGKQLAEESFQRSYAHGDVRNLVLDKGYQQIADGEIKLSATAVMTAAKQAADIELKEKDQALEMMKMFAEFASGSSTLDEPKDRRPIHEVQELRSSDL